MSLDLSKFPVAYENSRYAVLVNSEDESPYYVVNKQYDTVDNKEYNLPQALIIAKQYEVLLIDDLWEKHIDEMYGTREAATLHSIKH